MDVVYLVQHVIEIEGSWQDEVKLVGIFSNEEKAKEVVSFLHKKPGFRDYPIGNFKINKIKINLWGWKEGFKRLD